jgi:hypothetical protein
MCEMKNMATISSENLRIQIRNETTAILFFASSVSTFQNWNFLQIFKKEICESIFPV